MNNPLKNAISKRTDESPIGASTSIFFETLPQSLMDMTKEVLIHEALFNTAHNSELMNQTEPE
jgi:hypothetical protein